MIFSLGIQLTIFCLLNIFAPFKNY